MSNAYGAGAPGYGGYGGYGVPQSANQLKAALAARMMQEGTDTSPVRSPWQGAARLAQALTGGMMLRQALANDANSARQLAPGAPSSPYTLGPTMNPGASVSSSLPGSGGTVGGSSLARPGPQTPVGVAPNGGTMTITPPVGPSGGPPYAGMNLASSPSLGSPPGIAQAPPVQTASLDPSSGAGSLLGPILGGMPPSGAPQGAFGGMPPTATGLQMGTGAPQGAFGAGTPGAGFVPRPPGPPGQPPFTEAPQPGPEVAAADNDALAPLMAGIKQMESGGNYGAVGPATQGGHHALGAYQVMDYNVPQWTAEAGHPETPGQFLNDPNEQEAVARLKLGQYEAQTGDAPDAASMWFTGKPLAQGANLRDVNGVSGAQYAAETAGPQQNQQQQQLQGLPPPPPGGALGFADAPLSPNMSGLPPAIVSGPPPQAPQGGSVGPQPVGSIGPQPGVARGAPIDLAQLSGPSPNAPPAAPPSALMTPPPIGGPGAAAGFGGALPPQGMPAAPAGGLPPQLQGVVGAYQDQMNRAASVLANPNTSDFYRNAALEMYAQARQGLMSIMGPHQLEKIVDPATGQTLEFDPILNRIAGVLPTGLAPQKLGPNESLIGGNGQPIYQPDWMKGGGGAAGAIPPGVDPVKYREEAATRQAQLANPSTEEYVKVATAARGDESYKDADVATSTYNSMLNEAKFDNHASDKALIDAFAKINNPGRAVGVGQYTINADVQSLPDAIRGEVLKAYNGDGVLSPGTRAALIQLGRQRVDAYQQSWQQARQGFVDIARRGNIGPSMIPDVVKPRDLLVAPDPNNPNAGLWSDIGRYKVDAQGVHDSQHGGALVNPQTLQPTQSTPGAGQSPSPTPPQGLPPGAKQAPDGNFYVPDPNRPGKYLKVVP